MAKRSQRLCCPATHAGQTPHQIVGLATTRCPSAQPVTPGTERRDRPAEIGAEDVGKRQIEPAPARAHEVVQPVQRRIAHLHPHLTRAGIGDRNILAILQDVGAAVPVEHDRTHGNLWRARVQGRRLKVAERQHRQETAPSTFNLSPSTREDSTPSANKRPTARRPNRVV